MKKNIEALEIMRRRTVEENGAKYTYTLLLKRVKRRYAPKLPSYSVMIEMKSEDGRITSAESGYIFVDLGKAIVFYERLIEHLCTPLNLPYILCDSISFA